LHTAISLTARNPFSPSRWKSIRRLNENLSWKMLLLLALFTYTLGATKDLENKAATLNK
jgi:hypothetical protein